MLAEKDVAPLELPEFKIRISRSFRSKVSLLWSLNGDFVRQDHFVVVRCRSSGAFWMEILFFKIISQ
jgi:hypothetical protein